MMQAYRRSQREIQGNRLTPYIHAADCTSVIDVIQCLGAKGDGVTDDGAAINLALSRASNVYLPPGYTFLTCETLSVGSGGHLFSLGIGATIKACPALQAGADGVATVVSNNSWSAGNTDILIDHLTIDMSAVQTAHGIRMHNVTRFSIEFVHCISGNDCTATTKSSQFKISNNIGTNQINAAFDHWFGSSHGTVENNIVDGGGILPYGILVTGIGTNGEIYTSEDIRVVGNDISGVISAGIWFQGGVSGSNIGAVKDSGAYANTIRNVSQYHGIYGSEATNISIANNIIDGVGCSGIIFQKESPQATVAGTQSVIIGNIITNVSTAFPKSCAAIQMSAQATNNVISGNLVTGSNYPYALFMDAQVTNIQGGGNNFSPGTIGTIQNSGGASNIVGNP